MAFFITIEGIEGCGKTTQATLLADWLKSLGNQVLSTREPGGCPIADRIRSILLDPSHTAMVSDAELLLYAAARAQHVAEIIRPALAAGVTVICDRFTDATLAYQGYGRGLDRSKIGQLNEFASGALVPDLTLLVDYPAEEGLARARQRNLSQDNAAEGRFEDETLAFHQRVRDGYLAIAQVNSRMVVLDGRGEIMAVHQRVVQATKAFLSRRLTP